MESYSSKLRSAEADALFDAILSLRSREECYRFFEDICTIAELKSIAQRWDVACKLDDGVTYQEIAQQLSASTATISRVNACPTGPAVIGFCLTESAKTRKGGNSHVHGRSLAVRLSCRDPAAHRRQDRQSAAA